MVVDDERDAFASTETARRSATLYDIRARRVLEPPLHDGRTTLDRPPRGLEVGDDRVQLHEIRARPSIVAGSSAASAS